MSKAIYQNDLTGLFDSLERGATRVTQDVADQVLLLIGEDIADRARTYAPTDTGELRNSIEVVQDQQGVRVRANAPYAAYVEFGTWSHNVLSPKSGTYTIRPKKPGGVLRFTGSDGNTVFAKKVEHPGVKPQPFLGPANESMMNELRERVANVGVQLVLT